MKSLSPENLEKLFLFEVYVESLSIDYPKLCFTQNFLNTLKETIIQFQFLGFQPVEIREEEFIGEEENCGDRNVKAGKSSLFSLRDLPKEVRCLEVDVKVKRKTQQNSDITLGATSIRLGEQFANILKSSRTKKLSTSLKKPFTLYDKTCREIGKIKVNINLSCFGKMITTSFQLDGEDSKAYVVQPGGEVPIADFLNSELSLDRGFCPFRPPMTMTPAYPSLMNPIGRPMAPSNLAFMRPPGGLMGGFGPQPPMAQTSHYTVGGFNATAPVNSYPGQRPVQGGLLGGAQPPLPRCQEPSDSSSSEEYPPPPQIPICSCDYPLPPGFPPPAPIKKKKKKKKKNPCPLGMMKDFCLNPMCPKGYPQLPVVIEKNQVCQAMEVPEGFIGMKGEQMMVQLPLENQPLPGNRKARFNLGGGYNNNLKDVRIMTDGESKKLTPANKTNDVYVIKVGKINKETDQRQKVVLEVKQPKPPVDDRTFYDIRTQYLETDFMPAPPKKPLGKGKKGKGKKGKGKKGAAKKGTAKAGAKKGKKK